MATGRDKTYTAPSGVVVGMGVIVAPAIQISGSVWTPNRDGAGDVLSTDFPQLPVLSWKKVGGSLTTISEVLQLPNYTNNSSGSSAPGIVSAWGGAGWDYDGQRMIISGGGHGDSSAAETGVYTASLRKMQIERTVNRQPNTSPLTYDVSQNLTPGEPWPGGFNLPLSTGVPGSMHTYDGLVWIPPATMSALGLSAPTRGGLFYPGDARAVINLDSGQYTKLWWRRNSMDWSYCTTILDGTLVFGPRQSFNWWRFDLTQTEITDWQTGGYDATPAVPSFGKALAGATSTTAWVYNHKAYGWLRERREAVHFYGNQQARRFRYGQAIDAGATAFGSYMDAITLTSANGTDHLDFSAANLQDTGTNLLCSAGVSYDHDSQAIYVCANTTAGAIYRITGLSGSTWTVEKLAGTSPLTTSGQGTYGRFIVTRLGGALIAARVSGISNPIEVIRLQ